MSHYQQDIGEQIRDQGYRMTPQRQMVMDVIYEGSGHVTTSEIIDALQQGSPALNSATVYRVLHFLCDLQLITRTEINGQPVYELAQETPHHHLVCRQCGRVYDLPNRYFEPLASDLLTDYSFQAELNHMAISGICANCAESSGTGQAHPGEEG
jgi:Fur family ferric uptake transcriptional regulator